MKQTTTLQGETLDFVIFRSFDRVDEELLDRTYQLNPELAEFGTALPEGIVVKLPDTPASTEKPTLHLWD